MVFNWDEFDRTRGTVRRTHDAGLVQVGDLASYTIAQLINSTPVPVPENVYWSTITEAEYDAAIAAVLEAQGSAASAASDANRSEAARDAAISSGTWDYKPATSAELPTADVTEGQTALVRDTLHEWQYVSGSWVDTGRSPLDVKANRWVEESIGPVKFEEIPPDVPWMRVFHDAAKNILAGFRRNGKLSVALADDSRVPLAALNDDVSERLMNGAVTEEIPNDSGWSRVFIHDTFGIIGGFDSEGRLVANMSPRSIFPDGIGLPDGVKWASGPAICCSGDSMTAGAGGGGTTYPSVLASLTGRTVYNLGVGGETSSTIAGRFGAWPWLATVSGGSIPASGGVLVTLENLDGVDQDILPLVQGSAGVNPCSIAGVTGTLTSNSGIFTFTRAASGSEVEVPYAVPFVPAGADRMSDILILWWGQNDGTSDATAIISRQRATIEAMPVARRRYLVVGLPSGTDSNRTAMDLQFVREFGRRFVNIRKHLSSYEALELAGITPTSQDDADIAAGRVPLSLRSDDTHFNAAGYTRTANFIYARLAELGDLED